MSDPGIAGGRPVIAGTRITVNCIAGYYQLGMSIDEVLDSLRHLTPAQGHSALAYYFGHQERGFDVVHTQELKRKGKADREQLAFS